MPLKTVWFSFDAGRDNRLREVKTLETINDEAAAEFWKKQTP